ncbi:uncharacterized protein [Clytia hemisphaerica]|uniref:uncharacterized protein n=1 Tax=Clytia hemisphaerica TaxID=252671 RepID=UPI0034D3F4EB
MKYLVLIAFIAFAAAQPANDKRFFNKITNFGKNVVDAGKGAVDKVTDYFGGDDKPSLKDRLSDLKDELELIRVHNEKHMMNVTNKTNHGLNRVANALDKLNDNAMDKIISVEDVLNDLAIRLEDTLNKASAYMRDGIDYLTDMQEKHKEHFQEHIDGLKGDVEDIKED